MLGYIDRLRISATALKTTTDKKLAAIRENVDLTNVITPQSFEVIQEPFPHVIADNFFQPHFYADIERFMGNVLARGFTETEDRTRFHPFLNLKAKGKSYDGYLYGPDPQEDPIFKIFLSISWNLFFSELFQQPTGWGAELGLHHHPSGDRTGFVHHDYVLRKFNPQAQLPNGIILHEKEGSSGKDISYFSQNRIISLIYFAGNAADDPDIGGGTGLYTSLEDAIPAKVITPRNNRLFAFQISPKSFHAFQENKTDRNSIVQWFHVSPEWCEKRYGFVSKD